jgi:hypothetical protein
VEVERPVPGACGSLVFRLSRRNRLRFLRARDTHSYKLRLIPSKPLFRRLPNCSGYFWHLGMLLRSYPRRPVHNALVGFCLVCDDR